MLCELTIVVYIFTTNWGNLAKCRFRKNSKIIHIKQLFFNFFCNGPQENHRAAYQLLKAKINWIEKLKYEVQCHGYKFSIFKKVKNRDFQLILTNF